MNIENRLRDELDRAAERVRVAPDAWDRTRARYARGQRNRRTALAAAVAAVVAVAVIVPAVLRSEVEVISPPDQGAEHFPGFWPASSRAEAEAIQARSDDEPWRREPSEVAARFAAEFIGWEVGPIEDETVVRPDSPQEWWEAEVAVAPLIGEAERSPGTTHTLRLVGLPGTEEPAWFVASIRSHNISLDDPNDGAVVSDPVFVTGIGVAFEGTILTEVRDDEGNVLHDGFVMAGGTEPDRFAADLDITEPSTPSGIVILRGSTGLDGPEPDWTIVRVRFTVGSAEASCTNAVHGFIVTYPGDWTAAPGSGANACRYMDPGAFTIPEESEQQVALVEVHMEPMAAADYESFATDPDFWTVLSRRATSVDGRPAAVVEREVVELAEVYEVGTKVYGYIVDLGLRTLAVEVAVQPERLDDYETLTATLDAIATSVRFFDVADAEAADGALRCVLQARIYGDLEMAQSCMTERLVFAQAGETVLRFTVRGDVERAAERAVIVVRRYEGADGIRSYADDTFTVVRRDGAWLVDEWTLGDTVGVSQTADVEVYFTNVPVPECAPSDLGPALRTIPAGEDAARLALDELFTGAWEGDAGFGNVFPLDARVLSAEVVDGVAHVDVNAAAERGATSCSGQVRIASIERTALSVPGVTTVRITVEGRTEGIFHT